MPKVGLHKVGDCKKSGWQKVGGLQKVGGCRKSRVAESLGGKLSEWLNVWVAKCLGG